MATSVGTRVRRSELFSTEKDRAFKEDVHLLGELIGELIREQGGEALFDLVEAARRASIAHREGDPGALAVAAECRTGDRLLGTAGDRSFSTGLRFRTTNLQCPLGPRHLDRQSR
jgi:phosphoenolpyruvate carboxylase